MTSDLYRRNDDVIRDFKPMPGGTMSAVHFGPVQAPVGLIFLHANSFHGLAFRTILEPVAEKTGVHILALDQRGHGRTDLPNNDEAYAGFPSFARDLVTYLETHIEGRPLIAGHSMGACAGLIAASLAPQRIQKVVAFDPVIMPGPVRLLMKTRVGRQYLRRRVGMARTAQKRRTRFDSLEQAFRRYRGRGPFKDFPDEALWDYISGGFIPDGEGVRLACRPDWEARTYTSQGHDMKTYIAQAPSGAHILLTPYMRPSRRWIASLAKRRPDLRLEYRPDLKHFFPLTRPDIAINALCEALRG